ncbi:SRPBCC domain-containing protein [Methylomonas montana]|uniref:SRPBCC domain-containing protein n=1 Tax=Methylomonas montana TaxID=3058963 RepID=UPI00265934A0|nr:SRPBCC domain-containing protein [Methylomonas montana]WKJ90609.1 SRPBCC domain-containing protein [Methylomonas montana]
MKVFKNQRKITASSKEIFKAFADQTLLAKWWGPAGFTNTFNTFEFKPKGKWSFVMHGPDGTNYPNENIFQEIEEPNKVAIRHNSNPYFTLTVTIEDIEGGAVIHWHQDFDNEEAARNIAHIVEPANEQVLDKLQALVASS